MRILLFFFIALSNIGLSQFTIQDSIRGSVTPERAWWDVKQYDLTIDINPTDKSITGNNIILFKKINDSDSHLQIDLQAPMEIDSITTSRSTLSYIRINDFSYYVYHEPSNENPTSDELYQITIYFHGSPIEAKNAPWDGGIVWTKDKNGNDFVASAIQGLGASAWWPCKDHWSDEPDLGMNITTSCPANLMVVSNGTLIKNYSNVLDRTITKWKVQNPINAYGINFNIGDYVHWADTFQGKAGQLPLNFYVLRENKEKAKKQFQDVYRMLEAFEHWFGPYPFYEDGFKMVEVPYLGMEHQSSVTYGNGYQNGYLGRDLSNTGWGLKWDFIIVHESGHEWFANNITAADPADMWIHEGFTTYSEGLFTEYFYGKEAGDSYIRGLRRNILNDRPIIGQYDVNHEGSYDMYPKAANMLHTIRQIVNNDSIWLDFMRSINTNFRHSIVTTEQIEAYMETKLQVDLKAFFDYYLRGRAVPKLELIYSKRKVKYRWSNDFDRMTIPLDVFADGVKKRIQPTSKFQKMKAKSFKVDPNYFILH